MTFAHLAEHLARVHDLPVTTARRMLQTLRDIATRELAAGGWVHIPGLGVLDVRTRKARRSVAPPGTLDRSTLELPAMREPRFRAARDLKTAVRR